MKCKVIDFILNINDLFFYINSSNHLNISLGKDLAPGGDDVIIGAVQIIPTGTYISLKNVQTSLTKPMFASEKKTKSTPQTNVLGKLSKKPMSEHNSTETDTNKTNKPYQTNPMYNPVLRIRFNLIRLWNDPRISFVEKTGPNPDPT